jgi:hypothetical protein
VSQVEFAHDGATLVSDGRGTTRYWDVQSGEAKSVSEGSMFAFSKGSSREQKVGKFLITAEDDILRIFKSQGGVKDKVDKDTAPVAVRGLRKRRGTAAAGGGAVDCRIVMRSTSYVLTFILRSNLISKPNKTTLMCKSKPFVFKVTRNQYLQVYKMKTEFISLTNKQLTR